MSKNKKRSKKKKAFKTVTLPWTKHEVKVSYGQNPLDVARKHILCPFCKKALNDKWECAKCGIYLTFQSN